ncbi:hypothetical protein EYF80_028981 [Liparis tanakae]|uniref:Uncharacterized protein n=1 Tax=Liparis tanakae TaxID=230148 RepID=A0A4Z2H5A7_9TELE|nr:hypothetical protein EYF80_028981 [Liparis tanakae]
MAISASFSRPDSDIGFWKTYADHQGRRSWKKGEEEVEEEEEEEEEEEDFLPPWKEKDTEVGE